MRPCPGPPCSAFVTAQTCPGSRCSWVNGTCVNPSLPPTPPALCATQPAPKGYTCKGDTCGGATPFTDGNCGEYISVPTCAGGDCASTLADLCNKDPACNSFSLENVYKGAGSLHSQLFAGGSSCLRTNPDWTTYVKQRQNYSSTAGHSREFHGERPFLLQANADVRTPHSGSVIHTSPSIDGPFLPLSTSLTGCNNPSPWAMANGTLVVACGFHLYAAEELEGPWRSVAPVPISPSTRMGVLGHWEDPFLWQVRFLHSPHYMPWWLVGPFLAVA